MHRHSHLHRRSQTGAAALEFGLVALVLLTLLIGIIQFAIFFWAYQVGSHAAREGARLGAVEPCDDAPIVSRVVERVGAAAAGATPVVTVTQPGSPVQVGEEIQVQVTYNAFEIGFLPALPAIQKTAISRIEHVPAGGC